MRVYISSPGWNVMRELLTRCPSILLNILWTAARMPKRYKKYLKEFESIIDSVILDNGAFSAMFSKLDVTVSELITRFTVHSSLNQERYLMVFSPDFNFGPHGFSDNYEELLKLENANVIGVPVIHNLKNHEAWSYTEDYPEFVAIGQSRGRLVPENLFPRVFWLHHKKHVRVHLFGITDFDIISNCPAFSCDSKSWLDDAKTGVVRFWNPEKTERNKTDVIYFPDELDKKQPGMYTRYNYPYIDVFEQFLKDKLSLTMDEFIGKKSVFYRQLALIVYYNTLEQVVTELQIMDGLIF